MLLIRSSPSIIAGSANAEIPTCFTGVADLLGMLKYSKFTLDVSFFARHENFLHPKSGNLQEVSRESVHIYTLKIANRDFVLTGRDPRRDMHMKGDRVHFCTAGASPDMLDARSSTCRGANLMDLYSSARLVDTLENVHFFQRKVVTIWAEVLAGLFRTNAVAEGGPTIIGCWPFVSDIRTGAMCCGSSEQALLTAACGQMARHFDLITGIPAGITGSKMPDAQSGYEKALNTW